MNIAARSRNILFRPRTEWPVAAAEPASTGSLMIYAAIFSAIAQILGFIGASMALSVMSSLVPDAPTIAANVLVIQSIIGWVVGLVVIYVMSLIAAALAGSFAGHRDNLQALKLLVYAGTAVWVAGFFAVVPGLGWLVSIVGYAYAIYLIYLGAPHTVRVPEGKNGGYTAVVVIIWIVITVVLTLAISAFSPIVVTGGQPATTSTF